MFIDDLPLHRGAVVKKKPPFSNEGALILVPRGRAPFGKHQESRPLAWSSDIPVLNGFVNTTDWDQNQLIRFVRLDSEYAQSDGKSVNRGLPVLDWPEVAILGADQKKRGLWGREWGALITRKIMRRRDAQCNTGEWPGLGIEPKQQWWEASGLTTALSTTRTKLL